MDVLRATQADTPRKVMPFFLRPMQEHDAPQLDQIERDAFPTLLPPTSFLRELKRAGTSYLVAVRRDELGNGRVHSSFAMLPPADGSRTVMSRLLDGARSMWGRADPGSKPAGDFIAGYVGIWYVVDEVHIVSVGVRTQYRGMGIGEMLLIGAFDHAMAHGARELTLEVRVSNHVAKNLYQKYGFAEQGIRKGYYADNKEDAIIMTTDSARGSPFTENLQSLVAAHQHRWGYFHRTPA